MSRHSSAGGGYSPPPFSSRLASSIIYPETLTMFNVELASLIAQILIGAGQIGIVYYGISRMVQANDSRAQLQRELMERQERQAERRHTETMAVLKDQGQALQALIRGLDTQGQALKQQGQALTTLITRTGSSGTA